MCVNVRGRVEQATWACVCVGSSGCQVDVSVCGHGRICVGVCMDEAVRVCVVDVYERASACEATFACVLVSVCVIHN